MGMEYVLSTNSEIVIKMTYQEFSDIVQSARLTVGMEDLRESLSHIALIAMVMEDLREDIKV